MGYGRLSVVQLSVCYTTFRDVIFFRGFIGCVALNLKCSVQIDFGVAMSCSRQKLVLLRSFLLDRLPHF
jgi:hypothetical protein